MTVAPGAKHPILTGIEGPFHVRSWLYHVLPSWPPAKATRLLTGKAVDPEKPTPDNPVAWTWINGHGGKAFFTTLGHPEDFRLEQMQRLTVNAIHWALGKPVPARWKGPFEIAVPYVGIRKSQ